MNGRQTRIENVLLVLTKTLCWNLGCSLRSEWQMSSWAIVPRGFQPSLGFIHLIAFTVAIFCVSRSCPDVHFISPAINLTMSLTSKHSFSRKKQDIIWQKPFRKVFNDMKFPMSIFKEYSCPLEWRCSWGPWRQG